MDKCKVYVRCYYLRVSVEPECASWLVQPSGGSQKHINTVHFTNLAKQDWTMCDLLRGFSSSSSSSAATAAVVHSAIFSTHCCYFIRLPDYFTFMVIDGKREKKCVVNGLDHIDLEHCSKFSCVCWEQLRMEEYASIAQSRPYPHNQISDSLKFCSAKIDFFPSSKAKAYHICGKKKESSITTQLFGLTMCFSK